MKKTNFYYSPKLEQFNKLSQRLNRGIKNGTFYRLSSQKRNMLICRLKRLYNQLLGFIPEFKLKHILAAAVALVLGLSTQTAHAQWFAPPQTNPFGLTSTYDLAFPSFVDIDSDGDFDAFVGEYYGVLQYFENTGTNTAPAFVAPQANPFGLVSAFDDIAIPDFVDIDGDGDFDVFVGDFYGILEYFENTGTDTVPAFAARQVNPFGLVSVNGWAAPDFVDIDGDGDFDAFVGEGSGALQYFENTGDSTSPIFAAPQINPFGLVSVNYIAFPDFVDIDGDGDFDVFVGETNVYYSGALKYFENTGDSASPAFAAPQTNPFGLVSVLGYAAPAAPSFVDIDGDGDFDAFVGESGGALKYFENTSPTSIEENDMAANITIYPNPANETFNISIQVKNESEDMSLEIINSIGQTMLKEQIEVSAKEYYKEINTADFAKGLYFIKLSSKNSIITRKLIIL